MEEFRNLGEENSELTLDQARSTVRSWLSRNMSTLQHSEDVPEDDNGLIEWFDQNKISYEERTGSFLSEDEPEVVRAANLIRESL